MTELAVLIAGGLLLALAAIPRRRQPKRDFVIPDAPPAQPTTIPEKRPPDPGHLPLGDGVAWDPRAHPNPHLLIVGGSGSGKSHLIRRLASGLVRGGYGCLVVDFHGDLAVEGIRDIRISLDSDWGVNPLAVSTDPEGGGPDPQRFIVLDQLRHTFKPMGSVQAALVDDCVKAVYASAGILQTFPRTWILPMPHFGDLEAELARRLAEEPDNLRLQGLRTKIALAFDYRIFSRPEAPVDVRPGEGVRLDLGKLPPPLQYLAADTLLQQILRRRQLAGPRPLEFVLLIDESKLCTPSRRDAPMGGLGRIATEGRKFGLGLVATSQYVGHIPRDVVVNTFTKVLLKTDRTEVAATARRFRLDEDRLTALTRPGEGLVNFADSTEWKEVRIAG